MKKTIIFATVAIATFFAFSSCQKETLQDNGTTNGVRIITAEFENNATKTELNSDGVTPEWIVGDKIRILNATTYQDVTLISGEDTPTNPGDGIIKKGAIVFAIPETMTGTLYAVYPATATSMTSCTDSKITFAIPAVQDGTFGSANICVAKSSTTDETNKDHLVFSNATAVLEFSQDSPSSTGVIRVAVDAANNIAGTLTAEFDENNKATVTATGLTIKSIFTKAASTPEDKYYIAIAPGATGDVDFKYYKALQEATDSKSSATLERNKIYALSIPDSGYENSYVEITADYDNDPNTAATTLKWAKVNIGATKPEDFGHYFAWGYTDGCVRNSAQDGWVSVSDMTAKQFKTTDFPNLDNTSFQDAATANWGSNWRMPTANEFKALFANCVWYSTENEQGKKFDETSGAGYYVKAAQYDNDKGFAYMYSNGTDREWEKWDTTDLKFYDTSGQPSGTYDISTTPLLFFLRAGSGSWYTFTRAGGYYRSKDSDSDNNAYVLNFGNTNLLVQGSAKAAGLPIRPVSD